MTLNRLNQKPRAEHASRAVPRVYVYFDKDLHPEPLIEANWFCRVNSRAQNLANAVALATHVQIDTTTGPINPGPDVVSYFASPPELRDVDDLPVERFLGFPITRT
jgi:hypothetical protein